MENAWSRAAALVFVVALAGCPRRTESAGAGGSAPATSASAMPSASVAPSASAAPAPSGPLAGGSWVTCYARFAPVSTPVRDVTRLGLLCGPRGGMRQRGTPVEGSLAREGATFSHSVELKVGDCVRAFAVGDDGIRDLDLELRSPDGHLVTKDHVEDRWPILDADRPVCVRDAGSYGVTVVARRGAGSYALSVWVLPDE